MSTLQNATQIMKKKKNHSFNDFKQRRMTLSFSKNNLCIIMKNYIKKC